MNRFITEGNVLKCELSGKIDTLNCPALEREIGENMNDGITYVIFDLHEVDYISSTFLRIVIKLVKTLGKENFVITNVQPSVMKIFKISNLSELVNIQ